MKRILSFFLIAVMLLSVMTSCVNNSPGSQETGESMGGNTNNAESDEPEPVPPRLPDADLNVDMSAFGNGFKLFQAVDFDGVGVGILTAEEGSWDLVTEAGAPTVLRAQRAEEGSQYQKGKWSFNEAQNWSAYSGILFFVDFTETDTSNFHGASIRLYTETNGVPLIMQPAEGMTAYSSTDGRSWIKRHVNEQDSTLMHVSVDKQFSGYIYIPFSEYEGLTGTDALTAVEFDVCCVTSGEVLIGSVTLVTIEAPYEHPNTEEEIKDGDVRKLDLSKLVQNAEVCAVTDFGTVGAGTIENVPDTTVLTMTTNYRITVTRNGGDWYQSFDWILTEPQDWTGMAGVLVKADFTGANTNSSLGGHGVSVGIHTAELGETVRFNDPSLGGYAYHLEKLTWQKMTACRKYSQLLVVDPSIYSRYSGYIYIPLSAFGASGIEGISCVTSLTLYVGANTSQTAVVEGIWVVKGTELFPDDINEPAVNRDNDGTPVAPVAITSPVDLNGVVSDGNVFHITDFHSVGAGAVTNQVGEIQITENRVSVSRTGGWYDSFDWIFKNAQNWSDATGILVQVDFSTANTDANTGFHGIGFSVYTAALGDSGAASLDPALGGYLYTNGMWDEMDSATQNVAYLNGGTKYSGFVFFPLSSLKGLEGVSHVTGFNLQVGAITSGTAYIGGVYLVKGTVEVVNRLELWLQQSRNEYYNQALEGIVIHALGDSYFAGNGLNPAYVWPQLFAGKYRSTLNNYGKNGSTVSNFITTRNPMCERYSQILGNPANIILIEGGRNDYNNAVPIGTLDSYDTTTFMGALNTIVKGTQKACPDAMIVLITNWKFNGTNSIGLTYADYADAMAVVAEAHGVYCIRASDPDVVGVDMTDSAFRTQYCMSANDVSHLNLQGMKYVMPKFEKILAEYYTEFLASHEFTESKRQTVQTEWHKGYVGSSSNTSWANQLNPDANDYSYSDIITVEKAGTTITFSDEASGYASGSAYVISFWKEVDGEWVIDTAHAQYAGAGGNGSAVESQSGSVVTYTYTTQTDNEHVRLCYHSEQTSANTPGAYPTVWLILEENSDNG